jgi:hypothetical protein
VFVTACRIQKYTNNGTFIREWGKIIGSIAVDKSNGNVFVTATNLTGNDDHIEHTFCHFSQKFSLNGLLYPKVCYQAWFRIEA